MLGGLPCTILSAAILTHPTMAEGLNALFAAIPNHRQSPESTKAAQYSG